MAWRKVDRAAAVAAVVAGRRAGLTLAGASVAAGVHVATACRWQASDQTFARALHAAALDAARERYAARAAQCPPRAALANRPSVRNRAVPVHPCCPVCRSLAETRWVRFGYPVTFWRCGRWPLCQWASWRPRHPEDCPGCRGPMYWSCSRLSVSCPRCRTRRPTAGGGACE